MNIPVLLDCIILVHCIRLYPVGVHDPLYVAVIDQLLSSSDDIPLVIVVFTTESELHQAHCAGDIVIDSSVVVHSFQDVLV